MGEYRETVHIVTLVNGKEMARSYNYCCIFILVSVAAFFQSEECNCQFHWGKNHRLEAQKLKDMLTQMRPSNIMMTKNMVKSYRIKSITVDLYNLWTFTIWLYFLNLQPENVMEEKDDAAVGYIFTLQNGTPRNNSYRGVLICALFRSILPRCRRVLYPTFEEN